MVPCQAARTAAPLRNWCILTEPGCLRLPGFPIVFGWGPLPTSPSFSLSMFCLLLPSPVFSLLLASLWLLSGCSRSLGALVISGASESTPEMISAPIVPKETPKRCFPPSPPEVVGWDTLSLASLTALQTLISAFPAALAGSGVSNLGQTASYPGSFLQGPCPTFGLIFILFLTIWLLGSIFLSLSLNNTSSMLESDVPQTAF